MTAEERRQRKNEVARQWRLANPEKVREMNRRQYEKRRPERIACQRAYYEANRAKCLASVKAYYGENRDAYLEYKRKWALGSRYGISVEQYIEMHQAQGGKCAICLTHESETTRGRLVVDHIHHSGRVRALLCGKCNTALGMLQDNPDLIDAAASYVRKHAAH